MKEKLINITFILVSLMLFISIIVLTNDNIKQKIQINKVLPVLSIISILLIVIVLLRLIKNNRTQ